MRDELIATHRSWYGDMTIANIDAIYERIKAMLDGKRYTFATNNFYTPEPKPEVRTSQSITKMYPVTKDDIYFDKVYGGKYAHFGFSDQYCTWRYWVNEYVPEMNFEKKNPRIYFDYDKFTVYWYAPAGHIIIDVVAVEDHERYT